MLFHAWLFFWRDGRPDEAGKKQKTCRDEGVMAGKPGVASGFFVLSVTMYQQQTLTKPGCDTPAAMP